LSRLRAAGGGHFALTVDPRLGRRACHQLALLAESMAKAARVGGIALSTHAGEMTASGLDLAALAS
jgi:hypothetical protein